MWFYRWHHAFAENTTYCVFEHMLGGVLQYMVSGVVGRGGEGMGKGVEKWGGSPYY